MLRLILSYSLTFIILLSQVGLPLHMHYCKGMLESVSVFFSPGCDDHKEMANLPACCAKAEASHCTRDGGDCCDDKVKLLNQDITSLLPHFIKWADLPFAYQPNTIHMPVMLYSIAPAPEFLQESDSGPPVYILHHALIFYA